MEQRSSSGSGTSGEEESDESGFTFSSDGMEMKNMAEKIQKLESELLIIRKGNGQIATAAANEARSSSMMQMGWQMSEKFNKMEAEMTKMARKVEYLEVKNFHLENKVDKLREENGKLTDGVAGLREEIRKLAAENCELNEKQLPNFHECVCQNVQRRVDSMEKQFENVKKQLSSSNQLTMKNSTNKLDRRDCGLAIELTEEGDGLLLVYAGQGHKWHSIRAEMPIQPSVKWDQLKKDCIFVVAYFEVKILTKPNGFGIRMGFADLEFPLDGVGIGDGNGSIGVYGRGGICIGGMGPLHFECSTNAQKKYFREEDVAGCGLLYSTANRSMEFFAVCNGKLLGSFEVPARFIGLQLFPAISLCFTGQSIRANFGQNPWNYNPNQLSKG